MEEIVTALPWGGVATFFSGWTVVGLIVWMILTGRGGLATRREVDAQTQVTQTFKTAWETSMSANAVQGEQLGALSQQVGDLTTYAQASDKVLSALDSARVDSEARAAVRREQGTA